VYSVQCTVNAVLSADCELHVPVHSACSGIHFRGNAVLAVSYMYLCTVHAPVYSVQRTLIYAVIDASLILFYVCH